MSLEDVTRRMLALEAAVAAHPDPAVSVGAVIADLLGIELSDELEKAIVVECQRARRLANLHYAGAMNRPPDHPAILTAVGFLQGVTFARAAADVKARSCTCLENGTAQGCPRHDLHTGSEMAGG